MHVQTDKFPRTTLMSKVFKDAHNTSFQATLCNARRVSPKNVWVKKMCLYRQTRFPEQHFRCLYVQNTCFEATWCVVRSELISEILLVPHTPIVWLWQRTMENIGAQSRSNISDITYYTTSLFTGPSNIHCKMCTFHAIREKEICT